MHAVFVRKHEVEGLFGRPRYKWEHNLEMDLKEIRWESGLDHWFRRGACGGIMNTFPLKVGNFWIT